MPSGLKRGAALSQLHSDKHDAKRFRVDDNQTEEVDDEVAGMRTTFISNLSPGISSSSSIPAPTPVHDLGEAAEDSSNASEPAKTQQPHKPPSQDFLDSAPLMMSLLVAHEYDLGIGTGCDCGKGERTVQCQDCQDYSLSCADCWIKNHLTNPWHWARVWNGSFFLRSDISTLRDDFAVQLGHNGSSCPTLDCMRPIKFTVTASNGVHGTRISFCNCGTGSRVEQLMRARLFPASMVEPETAFTFGVLREYDIHSLQGKIPAYDYYLSLRRLTDNVHTEQVNDSYQPFMLAARAWRYFKAQLRLGGAFKLQARFFPHRPPQATIVHCPMCPDPAVNMVGDWWNTPLHYRHLTMMYTASDGNCKLSQFHKNSKNEDETLYRGTSYFPPVGPYKEFLASAKKSKFVTTSSECGHVKVINRQLQQATKTVVPKKKPGLVSTACSHVFVLGVTDMYGAENQAQVDASFLQSYTLYGFKDSLKTDHRDLIHHKHTYDAQCDLAPNANIRFARFPYLTSLRKFIRLVERGVPVVHITRHTEENCQCQYNVPHHWCNARVQGEYIEILWPEFNQVGGYTRQMNDANREDAIIAHINDWNHKKFIICYITLGIQLVEARLMFQDCRDEFELLSLAHKADVPAWSRVSRQPKQDRKSPKVWTSVYNRHRTRLPTVHQILVSLARQEASVPADDFMGDERSVMFETFWTKAVEAENIRAIIMESLAGLKHFYSEREELHIEELRERLVVVLKDFREAQAVVMAGVPTEHWAHCVGESDEAEKFSLGLPSDLTAETRQVYGLRALAEQEARLRESQIQATVASLKQAVNRVLSLLQYKAKNVDSEKLRTRTGKTIMKALVARDTLITTYNEYRQDLIALGVLSPSSTLFPLLTPADTFKKDPHAKRRVGDSKRREGALWTLGAAATRLAEIELKDDLPVGLGVPSAPVERNTATRLTKRRQPFKSTGSKASKPAKEPQADPISRPADKSGALWTMGTRVNATVANAEDWEAEGNAITWYRSEAELFRWLEAFEQRHAEFQRLVLYCRKLARFWTDAATEVLPEYLHHPPHVLAGFKARALRQAAMFDDIGRLALRKYEEVAHPTMCTLDNHLADAIDEFRREQLQWMGPLDIVRGDLDFGSEMGGMYSKPVPMKK